MTLSFVIPAFNEEGYLGPCIESILQQTAGLEDLVEVIVVNNASTDRTHEVAVQICRSGCRALGTVRSSMGASIVSWSVMDTNGSSRACGSALLRGRRPFWAAAAAARRRAQSPVSARECAHIRAHICAKRVL
jgi:cellulose synthase/poly-beta-1,6-N-acetylglucosamine synthase-like glycosyltransferase